MNENLNLVEILKDCPKGTKLYSIAYGDVEFEKITNSESYPILVKINADLGASFPANGKMYANYNGECALFPSKEQRDWNKFTAPWLKKERFDPKTLKPFDKVIGRHSTDYIWSCDFFSHIGSNSYLCRCVSGFYKCCIPYNEDTKHLVGTNKEAPEYYRYWED